MFGCQRVSSIHLNTRSIFNCVWYNSPTASHARRLRVGGRWQGVPRAANLGDFAPRSPKRRRCSEAATAAQTARWGSIFLDTARARQRGRFNPAMTHSKSPIAWAGVPNPLSGTLSTLPPRRLRPCPLGLHCRCACRSQRRRLRARPAIDDVAAPRCCAATSVRRNLRRWEKWAQLRRVQ